MNERQAKNWSKIRKFGFLGFLSLWLGAILIGVVISHFTLGYGWNKLISTIIGFLIGGIPTQYFIWRNNEKKFKEYKG